MGRNKRKDPRLFSKTPKGREDGEKGQRTRMAHRGARSTNSGKGGRMMIWGESLLPLDVAAQGTRRGDSTDPPSKGSTDRKAIDVIRHQVKERPQEPMCCDAPNSTDA